MKPRPFGLSDAMILVVAVAVGLCVNRLNWPAFVQQWWQPVDAHSSLELILDLVIPQLATGTIAFVAMSIRHPRPSIRRLTRQPGAVACIVALAAFAFIACWVGLTVATRRYVVFHEHLTRAGLHPSPSAWPYPLSGRNLLVYADRIGFAVAGAWMVLWLSGRWRSEPTWLDRSGRALGSLWLILAAVLWLRCYAV